MSTRAVTVWFIDNDDPIGLLGSAPSNDVTAAQQLASGVHGNHVLVPLADTDLASAAAAQDPHVYAGCYDGLAVLSCSLFATTQPSTLTRTIAALRRSRAATLLFTDPERSLGVFARWEEGTLRRCFAADPVHIYEDVGLPSPFERPFWAGERPLHYVPGVEPDPLALPFHPQELAEQSNRDWLGFRFTPPLAESDHDPSRIPVTAFAVHPADYVPTEQDRIRYQELSRRPPAPPSPRTPPAAAPEQPADDDGQRPRKRRRLSRYLGF